MNNALFCSVPVDSSLPDDAMASLVAELTGGTVSRGGVVPLADQKPVHALGEASMPIAGDMVAGAVVSVGSATSKRIRSCSDRPGGLGIRW